MLDLTSSRALVTGASGFIGGHLCQALSVAGVEVHAVSRGSAPERAGTRWHVADLSDPADVAALVDEVRPELVFHLASHVVGARGLEQVLPTFNANLASTVYLFEAVARAGSCRAFVQAGSLEEPDASDLLGPPSSPYAAAKAAASAYGRMFHALYDVPVMLARLFMVYGPDQKDLSKLIPYVTLSLLRGETPSLSSGERPVDWVYVGDVVEGLIRIAARPELAGRQIDIGSGRQETVRSVVEQLYRLLASNAEPTFGGLGDRPMEQVRVADVAATERLLGWKPETPLLEGLSRTAEWYRAALAAKKLAISS